MPRRSKGARLWLRKRWGRAAQWVILDHGSEIRTGASEHDLGAAENALAQYLANKRRPQFGDGHPSHVVIADVLAEYGENHGPTTRRADLIGSAIIKLVEFFGDKTLSAITSVTCHAYVRWRTQQVNARAKKNGKPITEATARRELVVLGAALRWCWKEGKIDRLIPIRFPRNPDRGSGTSTAVKLQLCLLVAASDEDQSSSGPLYPGRPLHGNSTRGDTAPAMGAKHR
jgi:hypothetical protein